jgi:hypothetical protein
MKVSTKQIIIKNYCVIVTLNEIPALAFLATIPPFKHNFSS